MKSNALLPTAGAFALTGRTSPAATQPSAADPAFQPHALTALLAIGVLVLAVWIVRRWSQPHPLQLNRTPGRPNRLHVLHVAGVLLVYFLAAGLVQLTLTPFAQGDSHRSIARWQDLRGLTASNTVRGSLYVQLRATGDQRFRLEFSTDPAGGEPVGRTGAFAQPSVQTVQEVNGSGLGGSVQIVNLEPMPQPLRLRYLPIAMGLTDHQLIASQVIVVSQLASQLVWLAAALLVARKTFSGGLSRGLGLSLRRWLYDTARGLVGYLACFPVVWGMLMLTTWALPPQFQHTHEMLTALREAPRAWQAPLIVSAVVMAPLAEELFFRGLIQSLLRARTGNPWLAILVGSGLFVLSHPNTPQAMPALFALSVVLGYNYERCGRLYPSILIHAVFNGVMIWSWLAG